MAGLRLSSAPGERTPALAVPAVGLHRVVREFGVSPNVTRALDDVTLEVPRGQLIALVGRSGSGKSSLLNLIAGIDTPTSGEIRVAGRPLAGLNDDDLTRLRRDEVGLVYQFFNLLPTLSALENVALPALLAGQTPRRAMLRAAELLEEVDLTSRKHARPHTLSGGEMQRTALARALVMAPSVLLADEPTGNLDSRSADRILALLRGLNESHGVTVILVTHHSEAAAAADRIVELLDGRVVRDSASTP